MRGKTPVFALLTLVVTLVFVDPAFAVKSIRIGNGAEPKDIDTQTVQGDVEYHVIQNIVEGLVSRDPITADPIPAIAERWENSKDGLKYTFYLRKDAKWTDGKAVDAEDFVKSFRRLVDPKTAAVWAQYAFPIKNAQKIVENKEKDLTKLGVRAKSPLILEVELEAPVPYLIRLLSHHSFFPVRVDAIEKHGQRWTRPENFIGNGPFKLAKWELGKFIQIVRNDTYYDKDKVKLDEAFFYCIESDQTEEKMFRAGQLDVTMTTPSEKIDFWKKDKSGVFTSWRILGTYGYVINVTKEPLKDKRVRRALGLAIDRTRLVKFVAKGNQEPATTWVPPGAGGFMNSKKYFPIDDSGLAEAKKLMAAAGYPEGKNFPKVQILYNTSEGHKKIAEAVQQMWKENLGVQSELYNQEWKVYTDTTRRGDFQITRFGWNADYNDPSSFLDMWMTGNANNNAKLDSPAYNSAVAGSNRELNVKKRIALLTKAEDILMDEVAVIPFYYYVRNILKRKTIRGWQNNVEATMLLKYVSVE